MARQFKTARQLNNMKTMEAAKMLQVSQPTLSAWEGERKSPTIDSLEKMADLYHVSTDFLLGRTEISRMDDLKPISVFLLPVLNGKAVWSEKHGWMLVSTEGDKLILTDGSTIPFADAGVVYIKPLRYAESSVPMAEPLRREDLTSGKEIWVEPISPDEKLRLELRGWYRVKHHAIENESGARFTLDSYGAKWLAFEKC